jgi:hypothetical protein
MDSLMRIKSHNLAKKTIQILCTSTELRVDKGRKTCLEVSKNALYTSNAYLYLYCMHPIYRFLHVSVNTTVL